MNTLTQTVPTMTSIEIAEATGKRHCDVMRAIRNMEPAWEKVNGRKFALVEYKDAKGQLRPCYSLTKTECLYIATKFNDEARAKLILRWERLEMERMANMTPFIQTALPSRKQILLYALQAEEEAERLRDTALTLLSDKYRLQAENTRLQKYIDYIIGNH